MLKSDLENIPTFAYLAILNKDYSPGVYNKILGTVKGAEKNGFRTRIWCSPYSPGFLKRLSEMIINSEEETLMVRSLCQYNFYLIYAFILAKRKGKKIILDVPTPNRVAIHEIANGDQDIFRKIKALIYLIAFGPIPYWFVTRVLQYSNESSWFLVGNKSKTKLIGNGIDLDQVPLRSSAPSWNGRRLDLICVASLNYWHGIDLLIQAIAKLKSEKRQLTIHLKVIGEGAVFAELNNLVKELGLNDEVKFLGYLQGEDLYQHYESSHLAVGSLALFRKNLNTVSELKSREYCAVGIPFIVVADDPDFPAETAFRIQLPNRDNIDYLANFFRNFDPKTLQIPPSEIRIFAQERLDFSVKINEILGGLT